ncbi:MAG: pilus assembly PilX N-terminal domain-containing protein [Spongiibacter sp.]|nr:pilus assembly PilX N-terminal domain-containing protein [Spongiibacter sp.]
MKKPGESGVVLIVVLIMLGIFSVIVVAMIGSSNINFKIAGNQQYRLEAKASARNSLESYLSNPANFAIPLPTLPSEFETDFNGDGVADMVAVVAPPTCMRSGPIKQQELDISKAEDAQCLGTGQSSSGGTLTDDSTALQGNSWCAKMTWDVMSTVNDVATSTNIEMHQGVYVKAIIGTPCLN